MRGPMTKDDHLLMNTLDKIRRNTDRPSEGAVAGPEAGALVWPGQTARFALCAAALAAAFILPLIHLTQFSWNSLLFSYIPFVPFMSGYLISLDRARLPQRTTRGWLGALVCATAGLGLLVLYWGLLRSAAAEQELQGLALTTAAFLLLLMAAAFFLYGATVMKVLAFPVAYCFFMVPFPNFVLDPVIDVMRGLSGWLAHLFLLLGRIPNTQEGMTLVLPNTSLSITPECSGFHATVALVLTALFGGHLILRSGWNRLWLALVAVPLGIVRNGFRVFVLSEMCVHQGVKALDSPMHSQGGKLFFAMSLVPLFLLLVIMRKAEDRRLRHEEAAMAPGPNMGSLGADQ
jgi:exosortase